MTTGLGCDGDSVSVTAASLPSIEDVVMGDIPGLPKVHLHNPVLAYEVGDDFMKIGSMPPPAGLIRLFSCSKDPFPMKKLKRRLLGRDGHRSRYRPAHHHQRMDRPSRSKGAGNRLRRHLRDLRRHSCDGRQSHRRDGARGLSRLELAIKGRPPDRKCARLSGATRQHDGDVALPALSGRRARAR